MTALFQRRAAVIVGTRRIDGLRIAFTVEKKGEREPNKASVALTNLSAESRAAFEPKGLRVVVEAGYADRTGAIFMGTSYRTAHKREGADLVTTIEAADGGKEVGSSKGAWSFVAGADVASAVRALAAGIGLPLSSGSRVAPTSPTFRNGFSFAGLAADGLDLLCRRSGLTWSVQDGQVQIVDGAGDDGADDVLLNTSTGMVGSPERVEVKDEKTGATERHVAVRCLIQPRLRPGRRVVVESVDVPALSGRYVVRAAKAVGDTHGADWTMALALRPL